MNLLLRQPREQDADMTFRDRMDRTWGLAAAASVVALLAGGVLIALLGRDSTESQSFGSPPPPAIATTGPSAGDPAAATPRDSSQQVPLEAPDGVTWQLFQGAALPTSPTAGPTRVEGPVHAGYARTPVGALIALQQISARFAITPGGEWRTVTLRQVVPGVGRDNYLKSRQGQGDLAVPAQGWAQIAGFRFVTYTPDVAAIQTVNRNPSGGLKVSTASVRWLDGDWKLELQPEGTPNVGVSAVDDLSGFIAFGGA